MPKQKKSIPTTSKIFTGLATLFALTTTAGTYVTIQCAESTAEPILPTNETNVTTAYLRGNEPYSETNTSYWYEPVCDNLSQRTQIAIDLTSLVLTAVCVERAVHYHKSGATICGKNDRWWLATCLNAVGECCQSIDSTGYTAM